MEEHTHFQPPVGSERGAEHAGERSSIGGGGLY